MPKPVIHRRSSSLPLIPPVPPLKINKSSGTGTPSICSLSGPFEPMSPVTAPQTPILPLPSMGIALEDFMDKSPLRVAHKVDMNDVDPIEYANSFLAELALQAQASPEAYSDGSITDSEEGSLTSLPSLVYSSSEEITEDYHELRARLKRKHGCLRDLYESEKRYVADLEVVVRQYLASSKLSGLSEERLFGLFGNITEILDVSMGLVALLERMIPAHILKDDYSVYPDTNDVVTHAGRAMNSFLNQEMFKIYEEYCGLNRQQMKIYSHLPRDTKTQTGKWLLSAYTYSLSLTTTWSLDSLLLKPIQRVHRYPTFLKMILANTPTSHPDYHDLDIAHRRAQHFAGSMNTRLQGRSENASKGSRKSSRSRLLDNRS